MGITIITCSGVSNTGKLTTQAGLTPMNRCPGKIDKCIEAGRPGALKKIHKINSTRSLHSTDTETVAGRRRSNPSA
ncbi:hypothetical protein [Methanolacinia petrolearia]|uniref:hypothetical protein n=1 Tax=Methanolacinia petrolearia TaxID=54120 RepID=UPI00064F1A6F|nr:hypothetical protein [Methanolacinia petrolearia]